MFAMAVAINEPFQSPSGKNKDNPQGDPSPLYHLHAARYRLLSQQPNAVRSCCFKRRHFHKADDSDSLLQVGLVEQYRFKPREEIPDLVEDIIAGLRQSTTLHIYWQSSPHRPQYRV